MRDDETQCFLHDTGGEPGQNLGQVPCWQLLDWLAQTDVAPAYVTIITDPGGDVQQVRTLYVPGG